MFSTNSFPMILPSMINSNYITFVTRLPVTFRLNMYKNAVINYSVINYVKIPGFFERVNKGQLKMVNVS